MELKEKLAVLREKQGLGQGELAEKMNVSRQAVYKWERGTAVPSMENLILLGELYGISLDGLVNGDLEEASGGVAVAVEAGAGPPADEEAPRKRVGWWKAAAGAVLAACLLLVTVASVITIWSAVCKEPEEPKDEIIWLEDIEPEYIDPAEIIYLPEDVSGITFIEKEDK